MLPSVWSCNAKVTCSLIIMACLFLQSSAIYNGRKVLAQDMEKGFVRLEKSDRQICGGVLITWKHVLTAATCVENDNVVSALVGAQTWDECLHKMEIESVSLHDEYDDSMRINNLAVVSLKNPSRSAMMKSGIYPVPVLWTGSGIDSRREVYAMGFGKMRQNEKAHFSNSLRNATLYKLNLSECQGRYDLSESEKDTLCLDGSKSTICKGDAGGPVMLWTKGYDNIVKPHVVAIVTAVWDGSSSCIPGNKVIATVLEGSYNYIARAVGKYRRF